MKHRNDFRPRHHRDHKKYDRRPDTTEERRRPTGETTSMEASELEACKNKGTLLRVRLGSNEEFVGRIEWYDQAVINLALADGSRNLVIFKHAIVFYEEAA